MEELKNFLENRYNEVIKLVENYEKVRNNDNDDDFKKLVSDLDKILDVVKDKKEYIGEAYCLNLLSDIQFDNAFDIFFEYDTVIQDYLTNNEIDYIFD